MRKIARGEYGYIPYARRCAIRQSALLLGASLAVYLIARAFYGTNANVFTVLAVLLILPAARAIVNAIMLLRARPCSGEAYRIIEPHMEHLEGAYDLYMTAEQRSYAISHLAVGGRCVAALTEDASCDIHAGEQHIRQILSSNGFKEYTVKIFSSPDGYQERLCQMERLEGNHSGRQKALINLMKSVSL